MGHLLLTADPFGLVTHGISAYLFYIRAVCYAIAAVICIVGALSVYSDMIDGKPEIRMKIMRLAFSCVFMITASTALPAFFGMDSTSEAVSSNESSSESPFSHFHDLFRGNSDLHHQLRPDVITPLPGGGTAVIWGRQ